jgi:hypothetical protein
MDLAAVPSRTAGTYPPPVLPAPLWTPVDGGVRLGLSPYQAEVAFDALRLALSVGALLVALALWRGKGDLAAGSRALRLALAAPGAWTAGSIVAVAVAVVTFFVMPFGPGWARAVDFDGSLFVSAACVMLATVWLAISRGHGSGAGVTPGLLRLAAFDLASLASLAGPVIFAAASSSVAVVEGQRALGVPYGLVQPASAAIYGIASVAAAVALRRTRAARDESMAEGALLLSRVAVGMTAFLGGWWIPGFESAARAGAESLGGRGIVSWQYATVCVAAGLAVVAGKATCLVLAFSWWERRLSPRVHRRLGRAAVPAAVAAVLATGAIYLAGLPASQGGLAGFLEATTAGVVAGSRFFGYGYLAVCAILTLVVFATADLLASRARIGRRGVG